MRFIDYIVTALRNIWRQKLRSLLTIFAVVIGATSVTIMLALVTGAKTFFRSQVEANGMLQQVAVSQKSDIKDFNDASHSGGNCDSCTKLTDAIITKIKTVPHVVEVARQMRVGAFEAVSFSGKKYTLEQVYATDANGVIHNNILAGHDLQPSDKEGVAVFTSDYADKFGFKGNYNGLIGKQISLQSRSFYSGVGAVVKQPVPCNGPCDNKLQQPPTVLTATIVGIMDTSTTSTAVRVPVDWAIGMNQERHYEFTKADQIAQEAACKNARGACNSTQHMSLITTNFVDTNGYDQLVVKADNAKNAKQVAADIKKFNVGAADAESMINSQLAIFNVVGLVLGGIGGIALAVAAIGVVNTMVMAILERTREIGVMRAVGARRSTVSRLFTFEASLLGFWGGVFGVGVGYGLTRIANVFINKQLASQSVQAHDIITLPIWLILTVIAVTTMIGMLAGLYPAHRAAKLDPVEALHYE
ncbi:MAG: transporter permease [Candidatus Saccharibacteria bacterium]|nr:transporter permease [Candidatus Saccharibacteria bacterium]